MCLTHQSQLAQSLLSCSTAFLILWQVPGTYPSFHFPSDLFCGPPGQQSRQFCRFSFCCWLLWGIIIITIIIILIIILLRTNIYPKLELVVFNWRLSDRKSFLLSRTFQSILADFTSAMVWYSLFFWSPCHLVSVPDSSGALQASQQQLLSWSSCTIFFFFQFSSKTSNSAILLFVSFCFVFLGNLWSLRTSKSTRRQTPFFLFIHTRSRLLSEIG